LTGVDEEEGNSETTAIGRPIRCEPVVGVGQGEGGMIGYPEEEGRGAGLRKMSKPARGGGFI
jgi:hypothetical protein